MSKALKFDTTGDNPGGFVAEADGYLCFVKPIANGRHIMWVWTIQSGGGWGTRGDGPIIEHSTGTALTAKFAEEEIVEELKSMSASAGHCWQPVTH